MQVAEPGLSLSPPPPQQNSPPKQNIKIDLPSPPARSNTVQVKYEPDPCRPLTEYELTDSDTVRSRFKKSGVGGGWTSDTYKCINVFQSLLSNKAITPEDKDEVLLNTSINDVIKILLEGNHTSWVARVMAFLKAVKVKRRLKHSDYDEELSRIKLFLSKKDKIDLNVNMTDTNGDTLLIIATRNNIPELVDTLLKARADKNRRDRSGQTAAMIAAKNGFLDILNLLETDPSLVAPTRKVEDFKVICDPVGLQQHVGECWVDTFQQLFFFSDGLKEITQKMFYFLKDEEIDAMFDKAVGLSTYQKKDYKRGIKAMRDRFINHYNYLVDKTEIPECSNPAIMKQMYLASETPEALFKRVKSARFAPQLAKNLQSNARKNLWDPDNYNPGENHQYYVPLWNTLFKVFNIRYRAINAFEISIPITIDTIIGIGLRIDDIFARKSDNTPYTSGHAIGFLKCNNQWYYYNDNNGLLPVTKPFVDNVINIVGKVPTKSCVYCINVFENKIYIFKLKVSYVSYNKSNTELSYNLSTFDPSKPIEFALVGMDTTGWVTDEMKILDIKKKFQNQIDVQRTGSADIQHPFAPIVGMYYLIPASPPLVRQMGGRGLPTFSRKRSTRRQKRTRKLRH